MPVWQTILIGLVLFVWGCAEAPPQDTGQKLQASLMTCAISAKVLVKSTKPTVTVSYTEPTTTVDGIPLIALNKTTIYYDLGSGPVKAMDVPATKPTGGGRVSQTVKIPIGANEEKSVMICVTATSRMRNEGPQAR